MSAKDLETTRDMLTMLITEATNLGLEQVTRTMRLIKSQEDFAKNVGNLRKPKAPELRTTLAFLLGCQEEDARVARLYAPGLRKMIMVRVLQLAPKVCRLCTHSYYYMRKEEVEGVACLRCEAGACPKCFTSADRMVTNKWKYICEGCVPVVENDMGFGRLELGDFDPDFEEKQKKKDKTETPHRCEKCDKAFSTKDDLVEHMATDHIELPDTQADMFSQEENVNKDKTKNKQDKTVTLGESEDDDSDDESSDLEDNSVFKDKALATQGKTIIKKATETKVIKKKKEDTICIHLKKGRCHFGISERAPTRTGGQER